MSERSSILVSLSTSIRLEVVFKLNQIRVQVVQLEVLQVSTTSTSSPSLNRILVKCLIIQGVRT